MPKISKRKEDVLVVPEDAKLCGACSGSKKQSKGGRKCIPCKGKGFLSAEDTKTSVSTRH